MSPTIHELLQEAIAQHQTKKFKKGLKTAEKARKKSMKEGDKASAIEALRIMGDCALNARKFKDAQKLYAELLDEAGPEGNLYYQSAACWGLGQLSLHKMSYFEAVNLFKQGLDFAERVSDGWYSAWNAFGLGIAYRGVGNLEKATHSYKSAIASFETMNQTGFIEWVKRALSELGDDTPGEVKDDLKIWLCPLCGSKFTTQQAEQLKKGKTTSCEYCGTSVG